VKKQDNLDKISSVKNETVSKSSQPDEGKKFGIFLENIHEFQNNKSEIDILRKYLYAIQVSSKSKNIKTPVKMGFMNSTKRYLKSKGSSSTHKSLIFDL
jgi:hypothetical protein